MSVDVRLRFYQQRQQRGNRILFCLVMQWMCGYQLCKLRPLMMNNSIKIGTRGSKLALWQANWVKSALNKNFPFLSIQITVIKTTGDKILDAPLAKVGGKGLFIKEIEEALLHGHIDLAVHSMKDMPAEIPQGLMIGSFPKRETPADVLISKDGQRFSELALGTRIGTCSLRRGAQLRYARPDIDIFPLRGNLDTRLKKLDSGDQGLGAIVLAAAGVKRLHLEERITEFLDETIMLPAVGQGALCIESRADDSRIAQILAALDDSDTRTVILGERSFLNRLEGSCQVPIAALGKLDKDTFTLTGLVADIDGKTLFKDTHHGPAGSSQTVGLELAERLLAMGADKLLEKLKSNEQ
jgi:hydroxymethylbilane synthase